MARAWSLLVAAAILGCAAAAWLAPLAVLNAFARAEDCSERTGLSYADGPRHGLDVYVPAGPGQGRPVVVFFYGGGWEEGERGSYRFIAAALAGRGFVTVVPDYRVYPQVRFPAFLQDAALAVRWAHDHAAQFGGDGGRLVLVGHSAGAHIAAMLTFDRQWLADVGLDATRDLRGMVGLAGPYDFLPLHSRTLEAIFGTGPALERTQPITFVDGGEAPVFLATGAHDATVDPGNTERLAARIRARGGRVDTRLYGWVDHRTLIGAFGWPLRPLAPVLADTAAFIRSVTGPQAAT